MAVRAVMEILRKARENKVVVSVATLKSEQETAALLKPEWARITMRALPAQSEKTKAYRIAFLLLKAAKPNSVIHPDVINDIQALGTWPLGVQRGVQIVNHFPWASKSKEYGIYLYGPPNKLQRLINAAEQFKTLPAQPQPPKKKFKLF
ncbi:MAG: hypothetical protein V1817_03740 [Candidatus Micrarchaeota archaeon]